jgi:5-methylcytosine-specific restriction protein A
MRDEFSKKTKIQAWQRCGGRCECGCNQKILGTPEYHHRLACALGGSNEFENCVVMSKRCHRLITHGDGLDGNSAIDKSQRILEKRAGVRTKRGGFRGWRTFNGEIRYARDR